MDHDESAEAVAIPPGWREKPGMVVAVAVEPKESPAQCPGCGTFIEAHRPEIQRCLSNWLGDEKKTA
jgi:hypothetical protein